MLRPLIFFLGFILFGLQIQAQNIQWGNITATDFDLTKLNIDTTKGAVIIADVGVSSFDGHSRDWFTLVFKRKCRVLIIDKNGFDLANVNIPLYITGIDSEEKLENFKGSTFNLADGKVVETKITNSSIFKDKYDDNHILKKITFPSVKTGSIIEYSYTIHSDFLYNLQSWTFQRAYPIVWSEYEVDLPDFFDYLFLKRGYIDFDIYEHPTHTSYFGSGNDAVVTNHRWVMKNIPALAEEKFITSASNHVAKLEFQLSASRLNGKYRNIMGDWNIAGQKLLRSASFAVDLTINNRWLNDDLKGITNGATTPLERARKIFYFVKNNIKSNDNFGIWLSQPIKDVFKKRTGSVADINLLLTVLLTQADLNADPVILSTRKHGATQEAYPILNKFNYVIARLIVGDTTYYLDASNPYIGFGMLPAYCYNGHARVITLTPEPVYFNADDLEESKITNVMLYNDDKVPGKWEGTFKVIPGYFQSADIRQWTHSKSISEYENHLKTTEYEISELTVDNIDNYERPVRLNYKIKLGEGNSDIIYFNPMLKEAYSENPFKSAERKYPVEMPYKINDVYSLFIDIPEGYTVEELPASTKVVLNQNDGFFEYGITKNETSINMRSKIKLEKATFFPEDYEALRNFFSLIVKKQNEQIVFKKKK